MTSHTVVLPRTSPTGRVPLWLLVDDALDSVTLVDGWRDLERAVHHPAVPVPRRAPGGRVQQRAIGALGLLLLAVAGPAVAVLDALGGGD